MNFSVKKTARNMVVGLLLCVCLTFVLFYNLTNQYLRNNAYSSASHLIEINHQGTENISALLTKDQQLARDISEEIGRKSFSDGSDLMAFLAEAKTTWQEDDIYLYTETGLCLNAAGVAQSNGAASQRAAEIVADGESFSIIKSQTEYAVAVDTDLTVRDSRIVAVSIVHNLDTLIDDIGLRPFSGQGTTYLTRQNGVKICQSGNGAQNVYNVLTMLSDGTMEDLTGSGAAVDAVMAGGAEGAFLLSGSGAAQYVVLTPLQFMGETLYLFEFVPQSVVNATMNAFTRNMTAISMLMVLLMVLLFSLFFSLFLLRSRRYTADIRARERLFDLLVSGTQNAFLLLEEGAKEPAYVSSNAAAILGEKTVSIRRDGIGFRLSGSGGGESRALAEINNALALWNGQREFVSGYLPYEDGTEQRYLRLSLYPVVTDREEFVGIVQDATPEYNREQRLKDAVSLADSANRAKTSFLSSVSHDIRTPLNAIINMTRFLRDDLGDRKKAEDEIDVIQQSSEHLLNLINNVLDLSRIESGKFTFVSTGFDIRETIESVTEITRSLCQTKNQTFLPVPPRIAHPHLTGDALRLSQILINLLNNAVKFTPEGGEIRFSAEELPSIAAGAVPFRFVVSDNGIGIPADKLDSIFNPFIRVENETVGRTEGSGLGLAITRNFVEAQGGKILVESAPGKGSVFTVELSFAAGGEDEAAAKPDRPCAARFDGLRALVAEDNDINLSIAETLLTGWGFRVESAGNGKLAAEQFAGHEAGYYSIVYMDIQMPVMNGYQAAEAIRASGKADAASIPIVAMTANAFAEDVERARAAGMNGHVAKPIDPDELRRVTSQFVAGKETTV